MEKHSLSLRTRWKIPYNTCRIGNWKVLEEWKNFVYSIVMIFRDDLDHHQNLLRLIAHKAPDKVFISEYNRISALGVQHIPMLTEYFRLISSIKPDLSCYFVTINWKSGVRPDQTVRVIQNILSKKWVPREYYFVYEQRGTDTDSVGTGYHNHFLFIDLDKPKCHIQREIFSTVKNLVGNKMHVDVRQIPKDWVQDKLDYMLGKKWDPEKDPKCHIDKIFRSINNLDALYASKYIDEPFAT